MQKAKEAALSKVIANKLTGLLIWIWSAYRSVKKDPECRQTITHVHEQFALYGLGPIVWSILVLMTFSKVERPVQEIFICFCTYLLLGAIYKWVIWRDDKYWLRN